MSKVRGLASIALPWFLSVAGCTCITPPADDSQSPTATLTIFFRDDAGRDAQQFVNTTDRNSPITVDVPAGNSFQTFYAGSDAGGVKTMFLDWKYARILGSGLGQIVQPLIAPDDFSSCAKTYRAVTKDWPWENEARQYELTAVVTDFKGNSVVTPKITLRHGP